MTKYLEGLEARIRAGNIRSDDIKHKGRLTSEQVRSIPLDHAFMWVQNGKWKFKDFKRWLACKGIDNAGNNVFDRFPQDSVKSS